MISSATRRTTASPSTSPSPSTPSSTSGKLAAEHDMAAATDDAKREATRDATAADGRPAPTTPTTPTTTADPTTNHPTPSIPPMTGPPDQTSTARAHSTTRTAREKAPRSRTRGALDSVSPHARTCSTPATSPNRSERNTSPLKSTGDGAQSPVQVNTARGPSSPVPRIHPTVRSSASMTLAAATVTTGPLKRPMQPRMEEDDEDSYGNKYDDGGKASPAEIEATLAEDRRIAAEDAKKKEEAEKNKKEKAADDTKREAEADDQKRAKAAEAKKREAEDAKREAEDAKREAEDAKKEEAAEAKKKEKKAEDMRSADTRASARTISSPSGARLEHFRSLYKLCGSSEARTEFAACMSDSMRSIAAGISVDEGCAVSDALQRGTVLVIKKRREEKPEEKGRDLRRVKRIIDVVAVTESAYPDEVFYVQLKRSEIATTIYRTGFLRVADEDFRPVAWPSYKTFTAPTETAWIVLSSLPPVLLDRADVRAAFISCLEPKDWRYEDEVNVALKFNSPTEAGWMKAMLEGMTLYGVKIIVENR